MRTFSINLITVLMVLVTAPLMSESVLRFVPHADLKVMDPIANTAYIARNHGFMIYDTLFAMDENYKPQPQMVDKWSESEDHLLWTFTLRDRLTWHDGLAVTAEDCVASLQRWGKRDGMGTALFKVVKSIKAVDGRTFSIELTRPFPLMLDALGKLTTNVPFMMPKRVAETDAFQPIKEYIGSGPFIFKLDEWKPGVKVVYLKNPNYVPRDEPASMAAGGKRVYFDRVEWTYLPDQTTALNALQAGEMDYWEGPSIDLLPILKANPELVTPSFGLLYGLMRFNHLHPPFDNPKVRSAVMMAVKQDDYLAAVASDPSLRHPCRSVFFCGTPMENNAMSDLLRVESIEKARQALKESGYDGTPVVILHVNDNPSISAWGLVTAEKLKAIGMSVDLQTMDSGSMVARRAVRKPPAEGGWSLFHTLFHQPALEDPTSTSYSGDPESGWFGWPDDPELEKARNDYLYAETQQGRMEAARRVQERIIGQAHSVPLGTAATVTAHRKSLKGRIDGPVPFLWNIRREE